MRAKLPTLIVHLLGLAAVCAIAAYWAIRIATPPPSAAPPPLAAAPARDGDPLLAARMFGLVQTAAAATQASNVQVVGVYAAGARSAAVLVVDGKPARTYLLGAQIAPGSRLAEVRADGVTIESNGVRQQAQVPRRPEANNPATPPAPGFTREGNVLTAPTVTGAPATQRAPAPVVVPPPPPPAAPAFVPPPPPPPAAAPVPPIQPGSVTTAPTEQTEPEEENVPTRRLRRSSPAQPSS
ncbi:MAG: type II secretion system protein N [Betaproteobacteria bacterium]